MADPDRPEGWVRMKHIFGLSVVPPESAAVIIRALNLMVATREVSGRARWQAVEHWAADYLAGYDAQRAAQRLWAAGDSLPIDERPVVYGRGLYVVGNEARYGGERRPA